ncbi:hypothetical protein ABIB18_004334 [Pantoea sp. UYEF8]
MNIPARNSMFIGIPGSLNRMVPIVQKLAAACAAEMRLRSCRNLVLR